MQKRYDIEIRGQHDFRNELFRISNELHDKAAHYVVVGSKQHQSIHKLRICLKKLRGIIRLLRDEITSTTYGEFNTNYSNIGKQVGTLRDYTSQITLLIKMHNQLKNSLLETTLKRSIKTLTQKRETEYKLFLKQNEGIHIHDNLLKLKDDFQNLAFIGDPDIFISESLRNVYKKARRIRKSNELWENAEVFHSWRKQVKYLMFQLMMLYHLWPKQFRVYVDELNSLQKILGTLHDFTHFKEILAQDTSSQINASEKNNIMRLLNKKEMTLKNKADTLGSYLFAESSKSFAKRIYKLWILKHPGPATVLPSQIKPLTLV